ncbi:MAG: hypothetical protein ACRBI6_18925 [Acidimicrobiales bacterium]
MTSRFSVRSSRLAALLALLLFAGACSSGSDDAADDVAVAETEADAAGGEAETDAEADDADAAEDADAADEGAGALDDSTDDSMDEEAASDESADDPGDGSCLVGNWFVSEAELDGYYSQIETGLDGVGFDITGGTGLSLTADGTYLYTPDFTFEMDADGIVAEGNVTGTLDGTYEVAEGIIETTVVNDNLDITVSVAGITMSATDLGLDLATFAPIASAPVDCSGENPVVMYDLGNGNREPVELTPA